MRSLHLFPCNLSHGSAPKGIPFGLLPSQRRRLLYQSRYQCRFEATFSLAVVSSSFYRGFEIIETLGHLIHCSTNISKTLMRHRGCKLTLGKNLGADFGEFRRQSFQHLIDCLHKLVGIFVRRLAGTDDQSASRITGNAIRQYDRLTAARCKCPSSETWS